MTQPQIPVLYLFENVFFPETIVPLVLTDGPSQKLITEAFKNDQLVALYTPHPKSKAIATAGRIVMVDDKRDDGKISAVIQGIARIQLTKTTQHIPYPIFEFNPYQDHNETQILKDGALDRLYETFEHYLQRHVHNTNEREIFLKDINSPRKLIFNISLFMVKDLELKILFLESISLADRISMLDVLFKGKENECENKEMAEAIKQFESFDTNQFKNIAN